MDLDFVDLDKYLLAKQGKIIHQVWFGIIPNRTSAKKQYKTLKFCRNSWIINNPDWFRYEWNKSMVKKLITTFYPEHMELFNQYRHEIQRCDMVRYLLLHRYGGWYVDMDYYCNSSLSKIHDIYKHDIYLVQSPNSVVGQDTDHISNSLMYSVRNHPFWTIVMIELHKNPRKFTFSKHLEVMFTTGPGILNHIYSKYKNSYNLNSLPWKKFHPFGINDLKFIDRVDAYCIHLGKGSWESKDSRFLLLLMRDWKIIIYIIFIYILLIMFNFYLLK